MSTKWEEPDGWEYADYVQTSQPVLMNGVLYSTMKARADELQSFAEREHSDNVNSDDSFPDNPEVDEHELIQSEDVGGKNNMERINGAIYPLGCVETDDIQDSGQVTANSPARLLNLPQLLEDVLGYESATAKHMEDTDSGNSKALPSLGWVKQWFQVMDYPKYYLKPADNFGFNNPPYEEVQVQEITISTTYQHELSPFVLNSVNCQASVRTSGAAPVPVEIYQAGDLNETALDLQQVRDYTISKLDDYKNVWWSANHAIGTKESYVYLSESFNSNDFNNGVPRHRFQCSVRIVRVRFKLHREYRPADTERFEPPVYWNGYFTGGSSSQATDGSPPQVISNYNDFGTGKVNNNVEFIQLTQNPDGWYYLEIENPNFNTEPFLTFPPMPPKGNSHSATQFFSLQRMNLEAGTVLTPPFVTPTGQIGGGSILNQNGSGVYIKPNHTPSDPNTTAFEFYTPEA